MRRILAFLVFILLAIAGMGQQYVNEIESPEQFFRQYRNDVLNERKFVWGLSIGTSIELGKKRDGSFRIFLAASIAKEISGNLYDADFDPWMDVLVGWQSAIEVYRGGLGTSFYNLERSKIWIDWRNTPQISTGYTSSFRMSGKPLHATVSDGTSVLPDPMDISGGVGTMFITGLNHRRNQQLGYFIVSVLNGQLYYLNDGPPMDNFGLGDRYDRWWTGSGQFGVFFRDDNNIVTDFIFRYDKFTGYQENLYEMGYNLQVHNLPYKKIDKQYFNQGRYQFKFGIKNVMHLNYSIYNSNVDVQDVIHSNLGMPFHATLMGRRTVLGFDATYFQIHNFNQ